MSITSNVGRPLRLGFTVRGVLESDHFTETCRRADEEGWDVLLVPDHLGPASNDRTGPSPFAPLVAAASATKNIRVGTFVLNSAWWNPALLAREIATVDALTEGRLEVGMGAGWARWELEAASIPWRPFSERVNNLDNMIDEVAALLAQGSGFVARQREGFGAAGPPLLIGGTGRRVLGIAARHANIVSHSGLVHASGGGSGRFKLHDGDGLLERVRFVEEQTTGRAGSIEHNLHIHYVEATDDPVAAAERLAAEGFYSQMTAQEILCSPFLLIVRHDQMATTVRARCERFGISYVTVRHDAREVFAACIPAIRAAGLLDVKSSAERM